VEETTATYTDAVHLSGVIQGLFAKHGVLLNATNPFADIRLEDGSRVHAVLPPVTDQPTLVIRKFFKTPMTMAKLIEFNAISPAMCDFLGFCVKGLRTILVAGGTGSGKTTVTHILAAEFIPDDERIIVMSDEIRLSKKHVVHLIPQLANGENGHAVTMRDLIQNAVKMRPERLVCSEINGIEAADLLNAINTGHDGSLFNVHATSPRDALTRLETMLTLANPSLSLLALREQMAAAISVVVYVQRLPSGQRKVMSISEVTGLERDVVQLQDIFVFEQTGIVEGKAQGTFKATGYLPKFLGELAAMGIHIPGELFVKA
jgi:pilus assembly protein CpaF